nr:MAG TPA: tail tube protein [Caudoviricetes sp.]
MAKLVWDAIGKRLYETGVKRPVLYKPNQEGKYVDGVAWNGFTSVNENPSGAESTPLFANDSKYLSLTSSEDFGATIEAYTYPEEFAECDGSATLIKGVRIGQQARKPFGLSYVTTLGNDLLKEEYGYVIHLVYGCMAAPSSRQYETINKDPEAIKLSWELTTTPVAVEGKRPTAHLQLVSTDIEKTKLKKIEDILYGTESEQARMPLPDEIKTILAAG